MSGFDRQYASRVDGPTESFTTGLDNGVRGLRIGVPRTYFTNGLQPAVERSWRAAVDVLVRLGATPVDVDFAKLDDAVTTGQTIVRAEMTVFHHDWYTERPADYGPAMHERFATGNALSARDYVSAQR